MDLNKLFLQLCKHEGVKYVVYKDTKNLNTVGIGHLLIGDEAAKYPLGCTVSKEQVQTWFDSDIRTAIADAKFLVKNFDKLSDVRQRAIVDLCYNLGRTRLSAFKNFLTAMNMEVFTSAALSLVNSQWYTQVGNRGVDIVRMIRDNTDCI
jgi:lysozyme